MNRPAGLVLIILLASTLTIFGQSVGIRGERITYTRPEPLSEFKRTFTVNYPRITAASPEVSSMIEALLNYEKAFDFTIEEELKDLQWLFEADFEVNYNANGILSIELRMEGAAAYPDTVTKKLNIDTVRGIRLFPKDVFRNLNALASLVKRKQSAEIASAKRSIMNDPDAMGMDLDRMFARANFRVAELNAFQVTERGVTFYYDYGFPHAVKALEPDGIYQFTWREMRPFIKPGGPLAKAAR